MPNVTRASGWVESTYDNALYYDAGPYLSVNWAPALPPLDTSASYYTDLAFIVGPYVNDGTTDLLQLVANDGSFPESHIYTGDPANPGQLGKLYGNVYIPFGLPDVPPAGSRLLVVWHQGFGAGPSSAIPEPPRPPLAYVPSDYAVGGLHAAYGVMAGDSLTSPIVIAPILQGRSGADFTSATYFYPPSGFGDPALNSGCNLWFKWTCPLDAPPGWTTFDFGQEAQIYVYNYAVDYVSFYNNPQTGLEFDYYAYTGLHSQSLEIKRVPGKTFLFLVDLYSVNSRVRRFTWGEGRTRVYGPLTQGPDIELIPTSSFNWARSGRPLVSNFQVQQSFAERLAGILPWQVQSGIDCGWSHVRVGADGGLSGPTTSSCPLINDSDAPGGGSFFYGTQGNSVDVEVYEQIQTFDADGALLPSDFGIRASKTQVIFDFTTLLSDKGAPAPDPTPPLAGTFDRHQAVYVGDFSTLLSATIDPQMPASFAPGQVQYLRPMNVQFNIEHTPFPYYLVLNAYPKYLVYQDGTPHGGWRATATDVRGGIAITGPNQVTVTPGTVVDADLEVRTVPDPNAAFGVAPAIYKHLHMSLHPSTLAGLPPTVHGTTGSFIETTGLNLPLALFSDFKYRPPAYRWVTVLKKIDGNAQLIDERVRFVRPVTA